MHTPPLFGKSTVNSGNNCHFSKFVCCMEMEEGKQKEGIEEKEGREVEVHSMLQQNPSSSGSWKQRTQDRGKFQGSLRCQTKTQDPGGEDGSYYQQHILLPRLTDIPEVKIRKETVIGLVTGRQNSHIALKISSTNLQQC